VATELVIKINGDIKSYEKALEDAQERTASLEQGLAKLAKISAVAFAGLVAEIGLSVKAFASQQDATNRLSQALQNQGIYTDKLVDSYRDVASEVQKKTGMDDDQIVRAQATIQALIGQTQVTSQLTFAIADLAEAKGIDLQSSAELIGKGIQGHTTALGKLGIQIDEHLSKEQRTAEILKQVEQRFGGAAAAANQGLGGIRGLTNAFGDLQENLGQRFAPIIEVVIEKMTQFISTVADNKPLLDLIASVVTAGAVVAGLGLTIGTAGIAFLKLQAALEAAKIATSALSIVTKGLVGATGLGLLLIIASEIYLNWNTIWPKMQQVYQAFANNVGNLSAGLGQALFSMIKFDIAGVKAGLAQMKEAISKGYDDITKEIKPLDTKSGGKQDLGKLQAALAANAEEIADEKRKQAILQAERELNILRAEEASAQVIQLKQRELDTLKQISEQKNAEIRQTLQEHLELIQEAEDEARQNDLAQREEFQTQILDQSAQFLELDDQQKALFYQSGQSKLKADLETTRSIKLAYAQQQLAEDVKRRNVFLLEEEKFGLAYATIHNAMNSTVYKGTQEASGQLVQLSNSKNAQLKAIGKAAAVTQIAIDTAKGAMAVYANFQTAIPFPPVSIPLGLAAAGAMIAYGAERTANVIGAAEGGIITGGIPNIDSVPVMAQQGELVVPKKNFEEVVNAVRSQREGNPGESSSGAGFAEIVISFKDDLMEFIEAKLVERSRLNISIQGA
jgi:hypothetical protein